MTIGKVGKDCLGEICTRGWQVKLNEWMNECLYYEVPWHCLPYLSTFVMMLSHKVVLYHVSSTLALPFVCVDCSILVSRCLTSKCGLACDGANNYADQELHNRICRHPALITRCHCCFLTLVFSLPPQPCLIGDVGLKLERSYSIVQYSVVVWCSRQRTGPADWFFVMLGLLRCA